MDSLAATLPTHPFQVMLAAVAVWYAARDLGRTVWRREASSLAGRAGEDVEHLMPPLRREVA